MKWICYDESDAFSIEAHSKEQAEKLASVYEAKVLGLATPTNKTLQENHGFATQTVEKCQSDNFPPMQY